MIISSLERSEESLYEMYSERRSSGISGEVLSKDDMAYSSGRDYQSLSIEVSGDNGQRMNVTAILTTRLAGPTPEHREVLATFYNAYFSCIYDLTALFEMLI